MGGPLMDKLCGRIPNTNIAMPQLDYVTLRAHCPVACGCHFDTRGGCPRSCEHGANQTAVDPCRSGLCHARTFLNASHSLGNRTCGDIDADMRASKQLQHCEILQVNHRPACCTASNG